MNAQKEILALCANLVMFMAYFGKKSLVQIKVLHARNVVNFIRQSMCL